MAKNELNQLLKDLDRIAATTLYNGPKAAAERAVRELQDIGPQWTGRFSNSWQIKTPDRTTRGTGGEGPPKRIYTPSLSARQVSRSFITKNKLVFGISNFSPYADQATDLVPYIPGDLKDETPIKTPEYGKRPPGGRRGDLRGQGGNRSTADLNWFTKYVRAGKFDKTVQITMDEEIRKSGGFK
jgi:hypothetical protein